MSEAKVYTDDQFDTRIRELEAEGSRMADVLGELHSQVKDLEAELAAYKVAVGELAQTVDVLCNSASFYTRADRVQQMRQNPICKAAIDAAKEPEQARIAAEMEKKCD